ncbi:hypothetical protein [Mycobacterium sp.]
MLNVELNIVGFRFSREIPDLRRKSFRSRGIGQPPTPERLGQLRQSTAA